VAIPAERARLSSERSAHTSAPVGVHEISECGREGAGIAAVSDGHHRVVEPFGRTIRGTRDDRATGCGRFERHVGEGVVASRQDHRVDCLVKDLDVPTISQESDAVAEPKASGELPPGSDVVATANPESMPVEFGSSEGAKQRIEPFSMPARAGKEPEHLFARRAAFAGSQLPARDSIFLVSEPLEVDAVGEKQDAVAIDALVLHEDIGHESRAALDALVGVGENVALHPKERPMARGESADFPAAAIVVASEVVRVASAAGSVEILVPRPAEAVHDVEALARPGSRAHRPIEGVDPERLPETGNRNHVDGYAALARALASDDVYILAHTKEFVGDVPCHVFDAAGVGSEAFDDDRDTQWKSSVWRTDASGVAGSRA
jgi:hypothetical protein